MKIQVKKKKIEVQNFKIQWIEKTRVMLNITWLELHLEVNIMFNLYFSCYQFENSFDWSVQPKLTIILFCFLFFSGILRGVIDDVVAGFIVLPNRITVPLTNVDPYELKYPMPDVSAFNQQTNSP